MKSFDLVSKLKTKLYIAPYQLETGFGRSHCAVPRREGTLMAFEFKDGLLGYSDFMPQAVFGEKSLSFELNRIRQSEGAQQKTHKGCLADYHKSEGAHFGIKKRHKLWNRIRQSEEQQQDDLLLNKWNRKPLVEDPSQQRFLIAKYNAFLDATSRAKGQSLFFGLKIPDSHFLIENVLDFNTPDRILEKGFQTVKVKLKPKKLAEQTRRLKSLFYFLKEGGSCVKWRLDLNGGPWPPWRDKLKFLIHNLDFIEDPQSAQKSLPSERKLFAQDGILVPRARIKVVKPSRDRFDLLAKAWDFSFYKRWVFTHSLDHPLGQVISAFWAGCFYKNHSRFFETGAFVPSFSLKTSVYDLNHKGPVWTPPCGFGWGFSSALKKEKWKRWL